MNETIGARLRALRNERGFSAREVSEITRISETHILKTEKDATSPGLYVAAELARLYGVSLDYIACLTDKQNNPYVKRT